MADTSVMVGMQVCGADTPEEAPQTKREDSIPAEDAILLDGLRRFENWAYEALISRFQQAIYSLVYRLLSDPEDAADVVQDVFIKVFRSISSFRGQSSLKTWVYRIAVNEAYNHRRWFGRRRSHEVRLEEEQSNGVTYQQVLVDKERSPYDRTLDQETRMRLEAALRCVKPLYRTAVILRDVEELGYEEIAEILKINIGTVKSRILRGREALRMELRGQGRRAPKGELAAQAADWG